MSADEKQKSVKRLHRPAAFAALRAFTFGDEANPAAAYLRTLAPGKSRATATTALRGLARLASGDEISYLRFPWHQLTYAQTNVLRRLVADQWTPAGANLRLCVLRCVLREAWRLGLMDSEAFLRAKDLRPVRGRGKMKGRALSGREIRNLIQSCRKDDDAKGLRDAAMLALLCTTGARRQEVAKIAWPADVDLERGLLSLRTKGEKHRQADLLRSAIDALEEWIARRGDAAGFLFCRIDRYGNIQPRTSLHPETIRWMCLTRAQQLGIENFTPHDCRRTFASALLDAEVDLHVVQGILDHENVATTARYDPNRSKRQRAAVKRLEAGMTW